MEIVKTFNGDRLYRLAIEQEKWSIKKRGLGIVLETNTTLTLPLIDPKGLFQYTHFSIVATNPNEITVGFEPENLYPLTDFQLALEGHQSALSVTLGLPKDMIVNQVKICYEVLEDLLSYLSETILPSFLNQCSFKLAFPTRMVNGQWILPTYFDDTIITKADFKEYQGNITSCTVNNRTVFSGNTNTLLGQVILDISPSIKYEDMGDDFQIQSLPSILVRRLEVENTRQFHDIYQVRDQPFEIVVLSEEERISSMIAEQLVKYIKDQGSVYLPMFDLRVPLDVTSSLVIIRSDRLITGSLPMVKFEAMTRNISLS